MQNALCQSDQRRPIVRAMTDAQGAHILGGLDYIEVDDDQVTLTVYFLGKLPPDLSQDADAFAAHLSLTGGTRIRDVQIAKVEVFPNDDPEEQDYTVVHVNKPGDYSTYRLALVDLPGVDPLYDHLDFSFKINCANDLDCAPRGQATTVGAPYPDINYLTKDYAGFRQLILDRLAVIMPGWAERHAPDLGIALVETLAYTADYLSYYQDAVATEAYLSTARRRRSVRRHARLVDYRLHEGCNARTWVSVETDTDLLPLLPADFYFITGSNQGLPPTLHVLSESDLSRFGLTDTTYFEPLVANPQQPLTFRKAHSEISFYTWGGQECCLPAGATGATLLDHWVYTGSPPTPAQQSASTAAQAAIRGKGLSNGPPPLDPGKLNRDLKLAPGDLLILEEVFGPGSGLPADADPTHRHVVRLLTADPAEDAAIKQPLKVGDHTYQLSTPVVNITWADADALPFALHLSVIGAPPICDYVENVTVARGNVVLADHGRTITAQEDLGLVPAQSSHMVCECPGIPGDVEFMPGRFMPHLGRGPLTYAQALPGTFVSAKELLEQDPHAALPQLWLFSAPPTPGLPQPIFTAADLADPKPLTSRMRAADQPAARYLRLWLPAALQQQLGQPGDPTPELVEAVKAELEKLLWHWTPTYDLLDSTGADLHFVVETDDDMVAWLRFGDGEVGRQPGAGSGFMATYRTGNGTSGNVGAEAISCLILRRGKPEGAAVQVRNPLPASGGTDPEPITEAKLLAPGEFRKTQGRAITADGYVTLINGMPGVQRAAVNLVWTGSWYEADIAIDPLGSEEASAELCQAVADALQPYRRMGHTLRVHAAHYVSLQIVMGVCVKPDYQRGHVKAALLDVFSNRVLPDGRLGFFHPDNLTFGQGIYVSQLVAAALTVPGVEFVVVTQLQRQYEHPNDEIANGVLQLGPLEIPRLDNDPSYPEHGVLTLMFKGGR
jgi:hypothetical protein